MNDAFFKPSLNVGSFVGENSSVDTERFLLFMQAYYEWMQSSTITLTSKTGTFVVGETVVGATSGATAIIKEVKTDSIIVKLTTRTVFDYSEVVEGQTSTATATVNITKDNVGRATGNVLNYKTLETSVDKYVDYLREELYPSIPSTYYGDKRLVAQYFKDFYESKSNEQSYRFLFKLLYDEDIDFYYPGTDVLRVSDGNFEKTQIIRTVAVATGTNSLGVPFDRDIFLFLNKTIRGQSSGFLANVVDIKKFFIGSREVAEMTLKLVSGTFTAGESIVDIDDANLVTTIFGIISGVTIIDGGSGYEEGDNIIISGDGSEAQARVSSIKESPISALTVNTIGHGYQLNTAATINNTGTGGSGFIVRVTELANTYSVTSGANTYTVGEISQVSVINRGEGYFKKPSITLQDTTISSLGLLSDKLITISNAGSNYGVGNTLVFTGGSGTSAAGQIASVVESTTFDLLFEDGFQMKADGSYYDIIKNEDWAVVGPIKRIELTNFGTGYSSASLPVITINTTTGSSANLIATNVQGKSATVTVDTSNNITGIGSIRAVEIVNFGINYSAANASASALGDGNAILSPVISGLGIKQGVWLDDDGKIDYKIIQDSYYYQDYSYVIKSGLTFQTYSNTLKSIIHPAGLTYFGEINILNNLDVAAELINNEEISRMLVQIFAQIYVGGEYEYSSINWTIKVEAPILRLDTDLLNVQEYVIHLVPEGDEETGITDVGVVINQGDIRHSFIIQTPFELDVTSTSATLPTTKFVVSKLDIIPGYGYNTYGNLPMTPLGVYGDYWAGTPISVLQDVRFSDLYNENPAYQSILNLYIDNSIDVGVYNTITRLNFETFAVSGIVPLVQSIITIPQPVIIRPEIAISLNDIGISMSTTEMHRELPVLIAETSTLNISKEYKLTGHGTRRTKYGSILLEDYQSLLISAVQDITFDEFMIPFSLFADMHVEADIISSTVAPQKFASAQNVASLYNIILDDVVISEVQNNTFSDGLPENGYQGPSGIPAIFETSTFGSSYTTYPLTYQEYVKQVPIVISGTSTLEVVKEYRVGRHAITLKRWTNVLLSEFESTPISTLADVVVGDYTVRPEDLADMHVDVSIAYSSVAPAKGSALNITSLYDVALGDVIIAEVGGSTFTDVTPQAAYEGLSATFETSTLETLGFGFPRTYHEYVKQIPVTNVELNNLSVDREIVVRAEGHGFKYTLYNDELLSDYSSTPISTLSDSRFDVILGEVYDATVKMSPSPYADGQAAKPTSSDIFRGEFVLDIASPTDGHSLPYDGIPIEAIGDLAISGTFYDRQLSEETLGTIFPTIYTKSDYIRYAKIAGTVSSANAEFSTLEISSFSSTPIDYVDDSLLSELAPIVIGSGTDFANESLPMGFELGSVFVANNEYFIVESIANSTYMTTDRLPASPFSGVVAYRISA
jgi:hypothetical protein